jgi:hypothetical protein
MELRADDVVRRADDAAEVADLAPVEPKRAKGSYLWQQGLP